MARRRRAQRPVEELHLITPTPYAIKDQTLSKGNRMAGTAAIEQARSGGDLNGILLAWSCCATLARPGSSLRIRGFAGQ